LHFVDLADTSRQQLRDWISARANTMTLGATEEEPKPVLPSRATEDLASHRTSAAVPVQLTLESEPKKPRVGSDELLNHHHESRHLIGLHRTSAAIRGNLKNLVRRTVRLVENQLRDRSNVDLVLSAALRGSDARSVIHYPVAYVDFLRTCIEPASHSVTVMKAESGSTDCAAKRFVTLVDELRRGLPAIEFPVAQEIALIADQYRTLSAEANFGQWAGDVGLHFSMSSSFGRNGRILFNIIRFMRSERCLELGTAYGMSALFILGALKIYAKSGHLTTVEGSEPQFSLGSSMLKRWHGGAVSCHFVRTGSALPKLVKSLGRLDFMFHDCGHSREDYVRDFNQVSESLAPGAVVLFDDIRWEDPRFFAGKPRTYEGWKAVVADSRVRQAVEIDDVLGLLLVR
jgi:predicted O-methyltransferase YrrM